MRQAILIILLHLPGIVQAQQEQIDSLQNRLPQAQGMEKVNILIRLANLYYDSSTKKSMEYGEEAIELAKLENNDSAIYQATKIVRRIHRRLGNFTMAVELTLTGLPLLEAMKDTLELLDSYLLLGNIYSSMQNYTDAHTYLLRAVTLAKATNHPELANAYSFLGRNYGKRRAYDSALFYLKATVTLVGTQPKAPYALGNVYNYFGEVYTDLGRYDEAIYYYSLARMLTEPQLSSFGRVFTEIGLARAFLKQGNYPKALQAANLAVEIAEENHYRDRARLAYEVLYEIYAAQENYQLALENYRISNLYKDSILNEDNLQYIENLRIKYETRKLAQENELLYQAEELKNSKLQQQRTMVWVTAGAVVCLIIGSFLLYRINVHRKQNNALLKQYNKSLENEVALRTSELVQSNLELGRQNSQLEQFSYIIAHNLRSSVARITGLVNLLTTGNLPDKEITSKLRDSSQDLEAILDDLAKLIDLKGGSNNAYERVNLRERFEKVCLVLRLKKIKGALPELKTNFRAGDCTVIPAYIDSILYNLVSNALKYRSGSRPLTIQIESWEDNGNFHLLFSDNGSGFDYENLKDKIFNLNQRFHNNTDGKGMGLYLVKTQVEAMKGTIKVASKVNEGTTFTITLPIHPQAVPAG